MRKALDKTFAQPDRLQQILHALFRFRASCQLECFERLANDLSDRHPRIERGVGILKNYLQVAAVFTHLALRKVRKILIAIKHLPGSWFGKTKNCATERRLPAT